MTMRTPSHFLLAVFAAAMLFASPPAQAQVSPFDAAAVREGSELVAQKKFSEAVARLKPVAGVAAGIIEFDLAYGIALLETGKEAEAATALRRVLAKQPSNMLARAQLARALATSGKLNEAKREIEVVRAREDLSEPVRNVMDQNLKAIDGAIGRRETERKMRVAQVGRLGVEDSAAVRRASELLRAKKPNEALAILTPLAARLGGDPDFDYVYGVAALDAGQPAEAVGALRRATENRPDFHLARAEFGRALAAMGDLSGAKREFERVRDVRGLPAPVRDAMGRQVVALDSATAVQSTGAKGQPQTRVTGYWEQTIGYDTNVNGGPAASQLVIPGLAFLGSATLDPAAMPKEAGFYEIAGGLSIAHAIDNNTAVYANLVGNLHLLFSNNEFNTALVGSEFGIARQVGDIGVFSFSLIGQAFWIDEHVFRSIYGAAAQWRKKIGEWDTNVAFTYLGLDYPNSVGMNADRYTVTAGIARRWENMPGTPAMSFIVNAGQEIARGSGSDHFSFDLVGLRYTGEITLSPRVIAFGQAGYEVHRHHADYPLFLTTRDEELFELLGGFEFKMTEKISVRPTLRWSKTRSNVDLFDNDRWIGTVATRWTF